MRCGYIKDWDYEHYKHSQGVLEGTITQLLKGELERIEKYHTKGDLMSINDILKYLDSRDRSVENVFLLPCRGLDTTPGIVN